MPKPVSRRELIRRLRALGETAHSPAAGNESMRHPLTSLKVPLPNPHRGDSDWSLTKRILRQAGISRGEWEQAGR